MIIEPRKGWFDFSPRAIWQHRDLISLFIKRDFVTFYKQTILGPAWYVIQPILTTLVFTVVFGKLASLDTDGIPDFLFYFSGNVVWLYFATCVTETSNTFVKNAQIFGKVYFPRMTVPISQVIINLLKLGIQLSLFAGFYMYYVSQGATVRPTWFALGLPILVIQMALLALGFGILVSSLTTKYRDLRFVMTFGMQLWMYFSSVVLPASQVPEKFRSLYMLNPMASIVEMFRYMFLGQGVVGLNYFLTSLGITLAVLLGGIALFSRIEKDFMDTI